MMKRIQRSRFAIFLAVIALLASPLVCQSVAVAQETGEWSDDCIKIEYEVTNPAEFTGSKGSFRGFFKITNLTKLNMENITVVVTVAAMSRFWDTTVVNHDSGDADDRTIRVPNLGPHQSQKHPITFRWTVEVVGNDWNGKPFEAQLYLTPSYTIVYQEGFGPAETIKVKPKDK